MSSEYVKLRRRKRMKNKMDKDLRHRPKSKKDQYKFKKRSLKEQNTEGKFLE